MLLNCLNCNMFNQFVLIKVCSVDVLLLTPSEPPEKSLTGGTVTASHKMLTPYNHFRTLSLPTLQREVTWAEERLLGDFLQSAPQNGRVSDRLLDFFVFFSNHFFVSN